MYPVNVLRLAALLPMGRTFGSQPTFVLSPRPVGMTGAQPELMTVVSALRART